MELPINSVQIGDCIDIMRGLPDACVDAVVTDPPYFLPAAHYNTRTAFRRNFSDLGILEHFYRDFFGEVARVLKPTGAFLVFCDGQSYPLFYWYGYHFTKSVRPLIWDKQTSINGYHWRHQHEMILFGQMPECKPVPTGDGDILRSAAVPVGTRAHPAQKPVGLMTALLTKITNEGDIVLDPFAGSGSTLVAARDSGRKFIGIELNAEYAESARARLAQPVLIPVQEAA